MSKYFPKPKSLEAHEKVNQICLIMQKKKQILKNAAGVATLDFVESTKLANLKSDVDKLAIDKLKNAPTNLSNLKSKVDKLDDDKLAFVQVDLSKLSDVG